MKPITLTNISRFYRKIKQPLANLKHKGNKTVTWIPEKTLKKRLGLK